MVANMPKSKVDELDNLVAAAASAPSALQRRNLAAKARKAVKPKVPRGRPSKYNEKVAAKILKALAEGKTIIKICGELGLGVETVYGWLADNENFSEHYRLARQAMAQTLVDEMLEESRQLSPDTAIVGKVKSQIVQWVASRYAPTVFSDSRRIELKSEVNVRHVHELPIEQRRKIAESWMMSQADDSDTGNVIEHEPDTTGVTVIEEPLREIPKRRRALPAKPAASADADDNGRWAGGRRGRG